jgi:hypothetical protein|nr:MAG TPA: nucelotide kinase [Caudoviricetes sp.]
MSNLEHPKYYQLNINLEVLDVINLVLDDKEISNSNCFYLGNVIKYLFRAEQKNGLEDYKKALFYFEKIDRTNAYSCLNYTETEKILIDKVLKTIENEEIRDIVNNAIYLHFRLAKNLLFGYIEKQEKQNEI